MQTLTNLPPSWTAWIADNLSRGCTPQSLVDVMVRERFDPDVARTSIEKIAQQGRPLVAYSDEPSRIARQGNTLQTSDRTVHLSLWMDKPIIALMDDLLSHEECDELIRLSNAKLKRSTTVNAQTGELDVIAARSSEGTFFTLCENDFIARLDRRIAEAMHWPLENGEGLQVLRYQDGGEYAAHFDYFDPESPGSQVHLARGGQRVSTLVMYLCDVPSGGETVFPAVNLSVVPKKGAAVYFEYCNSLGQVDPRSLHGGLPVRQGVKWIATKWMRQRRYA